MPLSVCSEGGLAVLCSHHTPPERGMLRPRSPFVPAGCARGSQGRRVLGASPADVLSVGRGWQRGRGGRPPLPPPAASRPRSESAARPVCGQVHARGPGVRLAVAPGRGAQPRRPSVSPSGTYGGQPLRETMPAWHGGCRRASCRLKMCDSAPGCVQF